MKLKAYIKKLQAIAKKHGDLNVVYSCDDEGNEFKMVAYNPSVGSFNDSEWGQDDETEEFKVDAVCLN